MNKVKYLVYGIALTICIVAAGYHLYQNGFYIWTNSGKSVSKAQVLIGDYGTLKEVTHEMDADELFYNNEVIISDDHVGFEKVYPKWGKTEIVTGWADCGGSACGRASLVFIDVKANPVFYVVAPEINAGSVTIDKSSSDVFTIKGMANYLESQLGDTLEIKAKYDRSNRKFYLIPNEKPKVDYRAFIGRHPSELLADKEARTIFLQTMTEKDFKHFRNSILVSGTVSEKKNGRFITGDGMAPHSGGDPSAYFAIDILKDEFLVAIYEDNSIKTYSNTDDMNDLLVTLHPFLKDHNMRWDYSLSRAVLN